MNLQPAFLIYSLLAALFFSCQSSSSDKETMAQKEQELIQREKELKSQADALAQKEDSLDRLAEVLAVQESLLETEKTPEPQEQPTSVEETAIDHPIRLGTHNITLQWISWDQPGTVEVSHVADRSYTIVGGQQSKENEDYLNIDGTITVSFDNPKLLVFQGKLEYRVSHNNGGEPCIKEGPLHFRASGNRKYWRMKEMTNCEGGNLVDYVDIYF